MISLDQIGTSEKKFQLKLLKEGTMIIEDFEAPQVIWKMDHLKRGVNTATIRIYHNKEKESGMMESSASLINYQIIATYSSLGVDVCSIKEYFLQTFLMIILFFREKLFLDHLYINQRSI